jgi:tRNA (guanine37-N1)-methyltransferase
MIVSPPLRKGLLELNRELFNLTLTINALRIDPALAKEALLCLKNGWLLHMPKIKSIIQDPDSDQKLVLLDQKIKSLDQLPDKIKNWNIQGFKTYDLKLDYSYWTTEEILRSILPSELDVPSAFETIGHIAHLNLRQEYDQFKNIIGQVIIDKSKLIKTVVNKIGQIHHTFRYFDMEVLAGEDKFETLIVRYFFDCRVKAVVC